mmetsp:Transcript_14846/g.59475  ORF Transcript_14846/g.59475 Transcript_14846/m.59475 type:complete len:251 (+) Transcript_14846:229-981(+)
MYGSRSLQRVAVVAGRRGVSSSSAHRGGHTRSRRPRSSSRRTRSETTVGDCLRSDAAPSFIGSRSGGTRGKATVSAIERSISPRVPGRQPPSTEASASASASERRPQPPCGVVPVASPLTNLSSRRRSRGPAGVVQRRRWRPRGVAGAHEQSGAIDPSSSESSAPYVVSSVPTKTGRPLAVSKPSSSSRTKPSASGRARRYAANARTRCTTLCVEPMYDGRSSSASQPCSFGCRSVRRPTDASLAREAPP